MIDTDKYEGHTPADEWLLAFLEGYRGKQILGLEVEAYHLGQMQACDPEDYRVARANQLLAREAPLLLEEVKRLREQVECSKDGHEWELDDYLDGDPNEPVRIVETCVACGLVRERIE